MLKRLLCVAIVSILLPAAAQSAVVTGAGPRLGFSLDPDQVVLGGQLVIGDVAPQITFDPNVEIGLGDNLTTVGLSLDLHYHFALQNSEWRPYLGLGMGIHFFDVNDTPPGVDGSSSEVGANVIVGAGVPTRSGTRFFTEMKFGIGDIPSLKMLAGWVFRM